MKINIWDTKVCKTGPGHVVRLCARNVKVPCNICLKRLSYIEISSFKLLVKLSYYALLKFLNTYFHLNVILTSYLLV